MEKNYSDKKDCAFEGYLMVSYTPNKHVSMLIATTSLVGTGCRTKTELNCLFLYLVAYLSYNEKAIKAL